MNFEDFPVEAIQSMEAEACVIGALLLDNGSWDRLGDKLKPEHFSDETHRMVFAEVARLMRPHILALTEGQGLRKVG